MDNSKSPAWMKVNDEGAVDVTLSRELNLGGAKTTVIRMREPLVSDQLAADKKSGSDAEKEIAILANLCMLTPTDIAGLPLRDYKRLQTAYMSFID